MSSAQSDERTLEPFDAPTALPSVAARGVALASVVVASLCGGLIGYAFGDLQGTSSAVWTLLFSVLGALVCSVGVAVMATLVLRSRSEWADEAAAAQLRATQRRRLRRRQATGRRQSTGRRQRSRRQRRGRSS